MSRSLTTARQLSALQISEDWADPHRNMSLIASRLYLSRLGGHFSQAGMYYPHVLLDSWSFSQPPGSMSIHDALLIARLAHRRSLRESAVVVSHMPSGFKLSHMLPQISIT